jgi:hypothetical protein
LGGIQRFSRAWTVTHVLFAAVVTVFAWVVERFAGSGDILEIDMIEMRRL